jgi:KUP system potassium uptake protein
MLVLTIKVWHWNKMLAWTLFIIFAVIDLAFLSANSLKVFDGGWVPLLIALVIFTVMTTWYSGRALLASRLLAKGLNWENFIAELKNGNIMRVDGCGVFMTKNASLTPIPLLHNLKHNKVLHKTVILLSIQTEGLPYVKTDEQVILTDLGLGIWRAIVKIGFKDQIDVKKIIEICQNKGLMITDDLTYFLGRESLVATSIPGMAIWREKLFAFMSKSATTFYQVPASQVFEVGIQVEL